MQRDALVLPLTAVPARRTAVPLLAALVPLIGGIAIWALTHSVFALCFAALGPLMMLASFLDTRRHRRREKREAIAEQDAGWHRAERQLGDWHDDERHDLWRRYPDTAHCLMEAPLRDGNPMDRNTVLVLGSGNRPSSVRVSGRGDTTEDKREQEFRARAAILDDAPVIVPLGNGVCLQGPSVVTGAAARALITQLCLRFGPEHLSLVGDVAEIGVEGFPHAASSATGAFRLAVAQGATDCVADAELRLAAHGSAVPAGITTVVDCERPRHAQLRTAEGKTEFAVESLSLAQTRMLAAERRTQEHRRGDVPDRVLFADLERTARGTLAAVLGRGRSAERTVDLVEDGPHAIVTGITGSGKSELLVTWIAAMAEQHGPEEVIFVLADFKGGSAFEPLRVLPHVAAIMTDLDENEARRGVQSLTAELRRREQVLADANARSIDDQGVSLARLVIVVDEFAALLQEHPDLGAVFTDLAARGRALGMHVILGTQRASGVIRDALAANCPLRLSLRVTDPADSRIVLGSEDAAALPGGPAGRGLALIRTPQDDTPEPVRVALTSTTDIARIAEKWPATRPRSPWLPALPTAITTKELRIHAQDPGVTAGTLLLGLADEPEKQRQPVIVLDTAKDRGLFVVGAPGSGRTNALVVLAEQSERTLWIPADPEQAWDFLEHVGADRAPSIVVVDDLDVLVAAFPSDHAQVFVERLEAFIRSAARRNCFVAMSVNRLSGPLVRLAEAVPRRVILRTGSKLEHLAAGGDPEGYLTDRPVGRGRWGSREIQICRAEHTHPGAGEGNRPEQSGPRRRRRLGRWEPQSPLTGIITTHAGSMAKQLREGLPGHSVQVIGEEPTSVFQAAPRVMVGDAASWQREWTLLQRIRAEGELLVVAECGAELRTLAGYRDVPPYARLYAGRAWSVISGDAPRRVLLPEDDASAR